MAIGREDWLLTLVAGNGTAGFSGDGGPATSAQLYSPSGVGVDSDGNLYFADSLSHRIREVSNGIITTVAGSGVAFGSGGFSRDGGAATGAQLNSSGERRNRREWQPVHRRRRERPHPQGV
jgi:hypothetical protein